jgi:F-type H+-transporting ATPase subunit b
MNLPLNIDWQQIFLHVFNFVILAGGLYLLIYEPVKDFMDKRANHYSSLEKEAEDKLGHAKELEQEYADKINDAKAKASSLIAKAEEDARAESKVIIADAQKQKDNIIAQAHIDADRIREQAAQKVKEDIVDLAVAATEQMMRSMENQHE